MQFPKLTPLQSRFAVSLTASVVLVLIYFFLWSPKFAYAAEIVAGGSPSEFLGSIRGSEDHNWARIEDEVEGLDDDDDDDDDDESDAGGETIAFGDESHDDQFVLLQERDELDAGTIQSSNVPGQLNINPGQLQIWRFTNASLWANKTDPGPGLPSNNYLFEDGEDDNDDFFRRKLKARDAEEEQNGLFKRQERESRQIYISINTCLQPGWNGSVDQDRAPPQLKLYVSNDTSNKRPGPRVTNGTQVEITLDAGFANYTMNATGDVFMSVSAEDLPTNFTGVWNYELAVSIEDYYHRTFATTFLHLVDTDTYNALLVTDNLTQASAGDDVYKKWMNLTTPFTLFAQSNKDRSIWGVENSYCGLKTSPAQIMANTNDAGGVTDAVQMGMITRGLGNKPKQQFYIKGLNASTDYKVYLAMQGNSTSSGPGVVGGGGQVWAPTPLKTKQDGNCQLIFNLTFCSEVAYAVPSNPYTFPSIDSLSAVYDSYAGQLYQNFNYSLQQVPCNTTSSAQYSLAKTCDDCAAAYKQWLCAVTMPRCEDFSSTLPWLQPRNMAQRFINATASTTFANASEQQAAFLPSALLSDPYIPMASAPRDSLAFSQSYASVFASNSSRNPAIIDQQVEPGPYKEVLPCADLCYSLVQSCPASLGFACPTPGKGLEVDYGRRSEGADLSCSYLGAVYYLNAASPGARAELVSVLVAGAVAALVAVGGVG